MIMDDDWGLHALVHGCSQQAYDWNVVDLIEEELFDFGLPLPFDLSSPTSYDDPHELDYLYKSLYSNASEIVSNSNQFVEMQRIAGGHDQQYELFDRSHNLLPVATNTTFVAAAAALNRAKRKKQQKRVVKHVTTNGLSTDLWAWRKYGQKPIKGSFYPRSYYKCSSSKGCAARKQVEQNSLDPNIFTITYTEDHNHPHPTRRSSLAGISKNKKATSATLKKPINATLSDSNVNISHATPLMQEGTTVEKGVKKERVTKVDDDDDIMNLGLGFNVDQTWFPHWLDGRSVC